jgi:hypothetical protein
VTWFRTRSRAWLAAAALVAVGVVALGGTALAGHLADDVRSYTGCLGPKDGVIVKVSEGDAPKSACTAGQTQVHLSGGDITEISVTGGLTGGGDNGKVTIGLDPRYGLPQGCATGQVAKWNSSTTAWSCGADNDTTYSAGTGLDLSAGNTFGIEPDYRVKNTPDCPSGEFATGFAGDGVIECAAPAAQGAAAWIKRVSRADAPQLPATAETPIVASLSLPAGVFLVHLTAMGVDDFDGNGEIQIDCTLTPNQVDRIGADGDGHLDARAAIAMTEVVSLASPGLVELRCRSLTGSDHLESLRLAAVRLASVTTQ